MHKHNVTTISTMHWRRFASFNKFKYIWSLENGNFLKAKFLNVKKIPILFEFISEFTTLEKFIFPFLRDLLKISFNYRLKLFIVCKTALNAKVASKKIRGSQNGPPPPFVQKISYTNRTEHFLQDRPTDLRGTDSKTDLQRQT